MRGPSLKETATSDQLSSWILSRRWLALTLRVLILPSNDDEIAKRAGDAGRSALDDSAARGGGVAEDVKIGEEARICKKEKQLISYGFLAYIKVLSHQGCPREQRSRR